MIVVMDAVALIHLAKISLLEIYCKTCKRVMIPHLVHREIRQGKDKPDLSIIENVMEKELIHILRIKDKNKLHKINELSIQKGEAESVVLYKEKNANALITDDNNVRKKKLLIDTNVVGTPAIVLHLYRNKQIEFEKAKKSIRELKRIGWFSQALIDKLLFEVENDRSNRR